MGYETKFNLRVIINPSLDLEDDYVTEEHESNIADLYHDGYPIFEECVKWYSWEQDMRKYSLEYPDLLFELSGVGEEYDDVWKAYFKNGKHQYCHVQMTFDPYDENKLK